MRAILIQAVRVWAPELLGVCDVLTVGDRVVALGPGLEIPPWANETTVIPGRGLDLLPGFVDQHVHIAGGGGEGGPVNRTPEIMLSQLTRAGITTVVGVLGTDGTTRTVQGLLAKARGLMAEGIAAWIYTGAYQVPTRTITDNPRNDLILIDRVVGVGEIAISDHRGSHPSDEELARLAGEARVGGILGGKAGVLHLHVGSGQRGLDPVWHLTKMADIPIDSLVPTHLNRSPALLRQAATWGRAGGYVDLTTGIRPEPDDPEAITASRAALQLHREGVPWSQISFSSDAQGSAPVFNAAGHLESLDIGQADTLFEEVVALTRQGLRWSAALAPVTTTPAKILHWTDAGRIKVDGPADFVLVDQTPRIVTVVAQGQIVVHHGQPVRWGRFEPHA